MAIVAVATTWLAIWAARACVGSTAPIVKITNGTVAGVYSSTFDQDLFLGIPYAQPPVGPRRFYPATGLAESWTGTLQADKYGPACFGYTAYLGPMSEDCLTLNIVRPHVQTDATNLLPVAVWIYGGGFFMGSSAQPSYNLSRFVQTSVHAGQPVLALSFNYRLSAFGWLWSDDVARHPGTAANVGFLDQRLLLHWVQDNIAAFGGDPARVVLFGESAGAQSVGMHLLAYGGRDDGLFRGAILQSGSALQRWPLWVTDPPRYREELYANLTAATGCASFSCLVDLPLSALHAALNVSATWMPGTGLGPFVAVYDGVILEDVPSRLMQQGRFVRVPVIYGTNSDEGTVSGCVHVDTDADFRAVLALCALSDTTIRIYESLYPNVERVGIPATWHPPLIHPDGSALGRQWKRVSAWYGDVSQHSNRRSLVQAWTAHGVPAYSYRFDIVPANVPAYVGATHAAEIAFVFYNVDGWGYSSNPFGDASNPLHPAYLDASALMANMWMSFVHHLQPNRHGLTGHAVWSTYGSAVPGYGENYVFSVNDKGVFSPYMESDDWRLEQIHYIQKHPEEVYR